MEILAPPDSLASLMTVDPFCAQEGVQTLQSSTHFNRLLRVVSDLRLHLEGSRLPYTLSSDLLIRNIPLKEGVAPDVALWPESLDLEGEEEYGSVELSADLCPALILEVVSENTHEADAVTKHEIYRLAGIEEYWLYDPRAYAGREPLRGWRLEDMEYVPILGGEPEASGEEVTRYSSAVLQTDWGLTGAGGLRLWDPQQQDWYRTTPAALRQTKALLRQTRMRLQQTETHLQQTETRLQQERTRAEQAEARSLRDAAEIARLRAMLHEQADKDATSGADS